MNSVDVQVLRGFDAESATLHEIPVEGDCFGVFVPSGALLSFDTEVAPRSGELAVIFITPPGRPPISTAKQLEHVDGKWYMRSFDGWNEFTPICEVLGKVVQVVFFPPSDDDPAFIPVQDPMTPAYIDHQARLMKQLTPKLVKQGYDRRTEYPLSRRDQMARTAP